MLSHRPSVVLVERNVAGLAVQMLLHAGVALVSNIKPRVLQRIARSTGADVMPSLDAQILNQKIGFCPFFRQKKIQLANGKYKCLLVRVIGTSKCKFEGIFEIEVLRLLISYEKDENEKNDNQ